MGENLTNHRSKSNALTQRLLVALVIGTLIVTGCGNDASLGSKTEAIRRAAQSVEQHASEIEKAAEPNGGENITP